MLLEITCHGEGAMNLSWLLHKHPDRFQSFDLGYGRAFVFFQEYSSECSTASLMLEINTSALNDICKAKDGEFQYVNARQYLSSSLLATALAKVYTSALNGICTEKPDLATTPYDFEIKITNFCCRLNPNFIEKIFIPLGYHLEWTCITPGNEFSAKFVYGDLKLFVNTTLQNMLSHLYILFPVFDRQTHFWLGEQQLQKFVRHSQGWLTAHPEKNLIINEYFAPAPELKYRVKELFAAHSFRDENEHSPSLNDLRQAAIESVLVSKGIKTVIDLGCGDGSLLSFLRGKNRYDKITGMDVSARSIEIARKKIGTALPGTKCLPEVFIGSLTYSDRRLMGFEAAILSEVIEHFEPQRMESVMNNILGYARPEILIITTPNRSYNAEFNFLDSDGMRHPDHRYEFDEDEFTTFCANHADMHGYGIDISSIGEKRPGIGSPTLMGVFKRCE